MSEHRNILAVCVDHTRKYCYTVSCSYSSIDRIAFDFWPSLVAASSSFIANSYFAIFLGFLRFHFDEITVKFNVEFLLVIK